MTLLPAGATCPMPLAHVWYTLGEPTDGWSLTIQHVHVVPRGVTTRFMGDLVAMETWAEVQLWNKQLYPFIHIDLMLRAHCFTPNPNAPVCLIGRHQCVVRVQNGFTTVMPYPAQQLRQLGMAPGNQLLRVLRLRADNHLVEDPFLPVRVNQSLRGSNAVLYRVAAMTRDHDGPSSRGLSTQITHVNSL